MYHCFIVPEIALKSSILKKNPNVTNITRLDNFFFKVMVIKFSDHWISFLCKICQKPTGSQR